MSSVLKSWSKKKVSAHPETFEDGTLWSVFIHHPLMRLALMNVFKLKESFTETRGPEHFTQCASAQHCTAVAQPVIQPWVNPSFPLSTPPLRPSSCFILLFHSTFTSSIHLSCSAWDGCRLALITIEKRRHYDKYCTQEEHTARERKTSALFLLCSFQLN